MTEDLREPIDDEGGNPTAANQQAGPGPVGEANEDRDAARDPDAPAPRGGGEAASGNDDAAVKDPSEWTTGDEPMTAAQRSYLGTLAREAGQEVPQDITKAEASELIDRLQEETGRGQ